MPANKNQLIRFHILDRLLSNVTRWHTADELLEKVNDHLVRETGIESISRRTLYSDLEMLQHPDIYNADLEKKKVGRIVKYRYRDKNFSIHKSPITPHQLTELQHILQSLERVSNFPFGEWLDSIRDQESLHPNGHYGDKALIGIEHNPDLMGMQYFGDIFQAIINKQVMSIGYQDFAGRKYVYTFHPYYLKQYNQRWFLIGHNEAVPEAIWNLALDRIQSMEIVDQSFIPTPIDFDDYFYDIIGVTHQEGSELETVLLRFATDSLPYVLTKPLHPSQKKRTVDSDTLIEIKVKPNYELYSVLRSFGKNVEILEPKSVRDAFILELEEALKIYGPSGD